MKSELTVRALRNTIINRNPNKPLVPSDRVTQLGSRMFVETRTNNTGYPKSIGQVGAYGDNTAMESFFTLLQKKMLNQHY